MARRPTPAPSPTRAERVDAILAEIRPRLEATARALAERAVDVPEAEGFGAIDTEFRDAGLRLANDLRQAGRAGRKKGVRRVQRDLRALRVRGQTPFLPGAPGGDGPRGGPGPAGVLRLRPVPSGLPPVRQRPRVGR